MQGERRSLVRALAARLGALVTRHGRSVAAPEPPADCQASTVEQWRSILPAPAARYFTDDGHEVLVPRGLLAEALTRKLADGRFNHREALRQAALDWSNPGYRSLELVANLPRSWRSFSDMALEFIEAGQACCYCTSCKAPFAAARATIRRWSSGGEYRSFYVTVSCPAGHSLLTSLTMHARMRRSTPNA